MKKIITLVIIALVAIACKKDLNTVLGDGVEKPVVITGQISMPDNVPPIDQVMIYVYDEELNDYAETKGNVDAQGKFKIELKLSTPKQLMLLGNSQLAILAAPGDKINVTFKESGEQGAKPEDVVFTGDHASTNTLLQAYNKDRPLENTKLAAILENQSAADLTTYLDEVTPKFTTYTADFIKKNEDDLLLVAFATADQKYGLLNAKLAFNAYAGMRQLPETEMMDLKEVLKNLPQTTKTDFINANETEQYLYYLTSALRSLAKEDLTPDTKPEVAQATYIMQINKLNENPILKDKIIYRATMADYEANGITFFENNKEAIKKMISDKELFTKLESKYKATKKLIEAPQIPAAAQLLKFNDTAPEKYLEEVIANANGKVIYIDNWATWCGPCKQEFKDASPALHATFKDDVEFVYFCHNSEEKQYLPSIAKFNIVGKHYFLTQQESQPIFQQLKLEGFPTYTIIDKSGNIVLSDYTHRPSYPGTTEVLTKLINE